MELAEDFVRQWQALGGKATVVSSYAEAAAYLADMAGARGVRTACGWDDPVLESAGVAGTLRSLGVTYETPASGLTREFCEGATLGVTTADVAVVETGTLAMAFGPGRPRSVGLLPPSWVAIVPAGRLAPARPDLIKWLGQQVRSGQAPAQIGMCSGPSRTGDIESILLTGVHGPGDVHAVLVEGEA